jgi:hypothetical protein
VSFVYVLLPVASDFVDTARNLWIQHCDSMTKGLKKKKKKWHGFHLHIISFLFFCFLLYRNGIFYQLWWLLFRFFFSLILLNVKFRAYFT